MLRVNTEWEFGLCLNRQDFGVFEVLKEGSFFFLLVWEYFVLKTDNACWQESHNQDDKYT